MNLEQGRAFLKCLHAQHIAAMPNGKWLRCSCVLAPWTHQHYHDRHPSFGLTISEFEPAFFKCFSCRSGSAEELLQTLEFYVGNSPDLKPLYDFKAAREILSQQHLELHVLPEFAEFPLQQGSRPPFVEWPQYFLDSFMPAAKVPVAVEYLSAPKDHLNAYGERCRGFTLADIQPFDIRYDHGKRMVVFPYRNVYGRLAGMRGRAIDSKLHHDYTWNGVNNAGRVWFNEPVLQLPGWVAVVEGQCDAMRVAGGWPKVVANLTALPTKEKLMRLLDCDGVVLIPDNDAAGAESVPVYRQFFGQYSHPFRVLKLPNVLKDPDDAHFAWLGDQIGAII